MRSLVLMLVLAVSLFALPEDSYKLTLFQPSYIGETALPAGDYNLMVDGNHVVFMKGRKRILRSPRS